MAELQTRFNESERNLLELFGQEGEALEIVQKDLPTVNLSGYDPHQRTLLLSEYSYNEDYYAGDAPPDGMEPVEYSLEEVEKKFPIFEYSDGESAEEFPMMEHLKKGYQKNIENLFCIGKEMEKIKCSLPKERINELYAFSKQYRDIIGLHNKIRNFQIFPRNILNNVTKPESLKTLKLMVEFYNSLVKNKLVVAKDGSIKEESGVIWADFVKVKERDDWDRIIRYGLAYCIVEFFRVEKSIKYIGKCMECGDYFIRERLNNKKFCSDKCRLTLNNRRRIESGEHREYKRKKRKEGAKESYYG